MGIGYFTEMVDVHCCLSHDLDLSAFDFFSQQAVDKAIELFEHSVDKGWVLDGFISQNFSRRRICGNCVKILSRHCGTL